MIEELGIGATVYGVLSRGLLTGSRPTGPADLRAHFPRFTGDNIAQNQLLIQKLKALARQRGLTPAQLAIAWVLARNEKLVVLIGARTRVQLAESLAALKHPLNPTELVEIEEALPAVVGTRYPEQLMRILDSER